MMKAIAVTPKDRRVDLIDHATPQITQPTEVKLRMLEVGICGTDREICAFEYGTPPAGSERLIIGHESLAEVAEVGRGVKVVRPGDLVVPTVRRPCHHAECQACRAGVQDFCYTGDFTERGIRGADGFFAEWVVEDERYLNVVPSDLRDVAVLVEPLTIAEKALMQISSIQQRLPWACPVEPGKAKEGCHRALVLGAGPVGLLGAMALKVAGFDTYVYSREEPGGAKARAVEGFGGHYVSGAKLTIPDLPGAIGNIDVVYEATGASRAAFELMKYLGTNGVFIFTGVPGRKGPVEIDTDLIMRNLVLKNQVVFGTVNASRDAYAAAIRDVGIFRARFPESLRALITDRRPLDAARDLLLGPPGGIKTVITIH